MYIKTTKLGYKEKDIYTNLYRIINNKLFKTICYEHYTITECLGNCILIIDKPRKLRTCDNPVYCSVLLCTVLF